MARPAYDDARRAVLRAVRDCLADLPDDRLVLVACSGGRDSLALAAAARAVRSLCGAVVVDHALQEGSAEVAERTATWLRAEGLDPVEVVAAEVGDGGGPEDAARRARYDALEMVALRLGTETVLLGHTRDDQAETVLLGLARGSGTRSLAGMPAHRWVFRRPLLGLPRAVVRAAVPAGAPVFDDPHNLDPRFLRVRVRETVLPVMERELGPGIAEALARTARLAWDDAQLLDQLRDQLLAEAVRGYDLDVATLEGAHPALRSRAVHTWLRSYGSRGGSLTAEHVERVVALVTRWKGQGAVALPGGVEATRSYGRLHLRPTPRREES